MILVATCLPLCFLAAPGSDGRDESMGIYTPGELTAACLHPEADRLRVERAAWLRQNASRFALNQHSDIKRVIQVALYTAEHEFLSRPRETRLRDPSAEQRLPAPTESDPVANAKPPDTGAKSLMSIVCHRIARDWPGGLSVHDQTMWWIPDLCRIASLSPEARGILRPVLTRCLDDLRAGRIWGTNIGVGLRCRFWLAQLLAMDGITVVDSRGRNALDPLEDWGDASVAAHRWGLRSILAHVTDDGLFNWDGTDLWYWWFTSRPALVAAGWHERHRLPQAERARFDAMYYLPIRMLCAGGAHPLIGSAKASPKAYRFFGGWVRDWPGADDASAWARKKIRVERAEPLRFDDLIYGGGDIGVDVAARPTMGRGHRVFGDRIAIIEADGAPAGGDGAMASTIIHFGDGNPINGGHRTPGDFPCAHTIPRGDSIRGRR